MEQPSSSTQAEGAMLRRLLNPLLRPLLHLFYPAAPDADPLTTLASTFVMQKLVGFNRSVPWPMHFTSRILSRHKVRLGRRSFPGWSQGCYIHGRNGIEIGSNLRMGPHVGLISANHDPDDYDRWIKTGPIRIGDDVWLGMNTVILPGVQIGDNCVIGANSVVSHDIPANSIAAGAPCRVIKSKRPYRGRRYSTGS